MIACFFRIFYAKPEDFETINILEATTDAVGYKARMIFNTKAKKLYPDRNLVELEDGRYVIYKKVLLATGSSPSIPPFAKSVPSSLRSKVSVFRNVRELTLQLTQLFILWTNLSLFVD